MIVHQVLRVSRFLRISLSAALFASSIGLSGCAETLVKGKPDEAVYVSPPVENQAIGGAEYFPNAVGNHYVYDVENIDAFARRNTVTENVNVTGIKQVGKETGLLWERLRGTSTRTAEVYHLDSKTMSELSFGSDSGTVLDPPLTVLRFPIVLGDTYSYNGHIISGGRKFTAYGAVRIRQMEDVTVPAGKFKTVLVESSLTISNGVVSQTFPAFSWYAPKVGIVQQKYTEGNAQNTRVLKSYKIKPS